MVELLWRVSGGGRCESEMQGGLVLITVDNCSSSNNRGNWTRVKGASAWKCLNVCVFIKPARIPNLSPAMCKQPLNFFPNDTIVPPCTENSLCFWLLFDTSVLPAVLAKGVGLTCYLGQRFSVFSISGTSRHLMRFFFPTQNEKPAIVETHHTQLKYKINSNHSTFKWVMGWKEDNTFSPIYSILKILSHEWSMINQNRLWKWTPHLCFVFWQKQVTIILPSGTADSENNRFIFKLHTVKIRPSYQAES